MSGWTKRLTGISGYRAVWTVLDLLELSFSKFHFQSVSHQAGVALVGVCLEFAKKTTIPGLTHEIDFEELPHRVVIPSGLLTLGVKAAFGGAVLLPCLGNCPLPPMLFLPSGKRLPQQFIELKIDLSSALVEVQRYPTWLDFISQL